MILFSALIVIVLMGVGWYIIWNLINDPDAPFEFQGAAFSHEVDPQEAINRIRTFMNAAEVVFVDDVVALLGVPDVEASAYLEYLEHIGELEQHGEGKEAVYTIL